MAPLREEPLLSDKVGVLIGLNPWQPTLEAAVVGGVYSLLIPELLY